MRPTPSPSELAAAAAQRFPPAQPGRRDSAPSDYSVTSKIERLPEDLTPAPLPPSPAAEAADVWFEQVPTNPAAVPDLSALTGTNVGEDRYGPSTARVRRASSVASDPWAGQTRRSGPTVRTVAGSPPWLLPALIAATCLAVGMIFGALIFGADSKGAVTPHMNDAGVCECIKK